MNQPWGVRGNCLAQRWKRNLKPLGKRVRLCFHARTSRAFHMREMVSDTCAHLLHLFVVIGVYLYSMTVQMGRLWWLFDLVQDPSPPGGIVTIIWREEIANLQQSLQGKCARS